MDNYDPRWVNELKERNLIPQLDDNDRKFLTRDLTAEEGGKTLITFGENKMPGNDGLTYPWYEHFWNQISDFFLNSFNESVTMGKLSTCQRQAVVKLLEKPGKSRLEIKNLRPLMLLNSDVKIISKTFARRITHIHPKLIGENQLAYVKGRFIGEGCKPN